MTKEESILVAAEARRSNRRYGTILTRVYPHPHFNEPTITISVEATGASVTVHGSVRGGGYAHRYHSRVSPGQPLDTRLRTAFRRTVERATEQYWRNLADSRRLNSPLLWERGITPLLLDRGHATYGTRYTAYWTIDLCKEVVGLTDKAEAWRRARDAQQGWTDELVDTWRELQQVAQQE